MAEIIKHPSFLAVRAEETAPLLPEMAAEAAAARNETARKLAEKAEKLLASKAAGSAGPKAPGAVAPKARKPHHMGHRKRLRERFLESGPGALADYELLEMVLFPAKPQGDVKPLAKQLLASFGSFAGVLNAEPRALAAIDGVGEAAIGAIKVVRAAAQKLLQTEASAQPVLQSWEALLDYCRVAMGHAKVEEFRLLFLNQRNALIRDEVQQRGTINHTPVYPREVVKRGLELNAAALILLHNHPSGDVTPSTADIEVTNQIVQACGAVGIRVHDHVIIGAAEHFSMRAHGLIG